MFTFSISPDLRDLPDAEVTAEVTAGQLGTDGARTVARWWQDSAPGHGAALLDLAMGRPVRPYELHRDIAAARATVTGSEPAEAAALDALAEWVDRQAAPVVAEVLWQAAAWVARHGLPGHEPRSGCAAGVEGALCAAITGAPDRETLPGGNRWRHPAGYQAAADALVEWLRGRYPGRVPRLGIADDWPNDPHTASLLRDAARWVEARATIPRALQAVRDALLDADGAWSPDVQVAAMAALSWAVDADWSAAVDRDGADLRLVIHRPDAGPDDQPVLVCPLRAGIDNRGWRSVPLGQEQDLLEARSDL